MTPTAGAQHDDGARTAITRWAILAGTGESLLAVGARTANVAAGQVGIDNRAVERVFTATIDGGVSGASIRNVAGDGVGIDGESLSAADTHLTVTDGEITIGNVAALSFDGAVSVAENGRRVTIER